MRIIGITGGIGAGKSEVIEYLQEHYEAEVAKSDDIGHAALKKGSICYLDIIDLLGFDIIEEDGELSRAKISKIVHADKEKLDKLDAILHPYIGECIAKMIIDVRKETKYFFIEAALLLEANYDEMCDEVWYIYASPEIRCKRLSKSRDISVSKARQIMANQLSDEEFKEKCDFVIDNSGDFTDTIKQINSRIQKYEIV